MQKFKNEKRDGFRIPIIMDVPPEVSAAITQRVAEDTTYIVMREKKIKKTYNNLKVSSLRKVGEYLLNNWAIGEMKIKDISNETGMAESSVKVAITDLNFWREYPLRMIPVPSKPGIIQNSLKDINTTEKYLKKKSRTIASMEQVYGNVDAQVKVKQQTEPMRKKQVIEEKSEKSSEKEEEEED